MPLLTLPQGVAYATPYSSAYAAQEATMKKNTDHNKAELILTMIEILGDDATARQRRIVLAHLRNASDAVKGIVRDNALLYADPLGRWPREIKMAIEG